MTNFIILKKEREVIKMKKKKYLKNTTKRLEN